MTSGRTPAVIVLGIVLTLTLVGGNLVFAAQSSVLDSRFVTDAIEEEDGYEALAQEMRREVSNATDEATGSEPGGSFSTILEDDPIESAVTPEYVKSQVGPNVEAIYAYLHGETDRLSLSLDVQSLAGTVGDDVADSVREASVTELIEGAPGDPLADVPVDATFVQRLNDGAESYEAAKADLRQDLREEALDAAVEEAYTNESNDRLLALVIPDYDPRDYSEAEKERMVDDREGEIRDALRDRIEEEGGDEVDEAVQSRLDDVREAAGTQPSADEVGDQAIADAAGDLQTAVLTAATTDQSYEAYRADVTSAREDLAAAVGGYASDQFTQEAGTIDLNERMGIAEQGELDGPRTVVSYLDLSAIVLPILALLLIGAVWLLTRSVVVTAATTGVSLVVATLPALIGAPILGDRLRSMLEMEGDAATTLEPVIEGVIGRTIETITTQSLLLAVLGLVLVGVAVALYYDAHEYVFDTGAGR